MHEMCPWFTKQIRKGGPKKKKREKKKEIFIRKPLSKRFIKDYKLSDMKCH